MVLLGLSLARLLTLAAVVLSLTALLYVLKLRRRGVRVPFSPIWQRILGDKDASQLFSRLKRWLSLLLQACLIGLVLFALGDPRFTARWVEGRNVVVLLDVSASMKASDVAPSRIEVAKQRVGKLVDGLGGNDKMLLAELGQTPRPLTTMTDDVGELAAALRDVGAKDVSADLERGLAFALDSLRGATKPEIVLVSDGALAGRDGVGSGVSLAGVQLSYVPIGQGGDNAAITAFSVRRYPLDRSRTEALLAVSNFGSAPQQVEITLYGDGEPIDVLRTELAAGATFDHVYVNLAGAARELRAELRVLSGADYLDADNHAYALMPERKRARVLVLTAGSTYLEAALLLDEYLDVTVGDPAGTLPPGPFDVTILDRVAPELPVQYGALLYLDPPEGSPLGYKKAITDFGFDDWDRKSPLLRWIAPENIQVAKGHAFALGAGDRVVGASEHGPILVAGTRAGRRFVALGFDPRDSDFVLRVGWPLFVLNCINTFVETDVRFLSSLRTGESWHVDVAPGLEEVQLAAPDGSRTTLAARGGKVSLFGEQAGYYTLLGPDNAELSRFAANLVNPDESRLDVQSNLQVQGVQAQPVAGYTPGVRREIWWYLVAVAAVVSMLEWFSYHRRITV